MQTDVKTDKKRRLFPSFFTVHLKQKKRPAINTAIYKARQKKKQERNTALIYKAG